MLQIKNLKHWRIETRDVLLAVGCFHNDSLLYLGHGRDPLVKTELECLNRDLFVEGMNKDELPKKHYTVMIKLIDTEDYHGKDGEVNFSTELEILSCCNHDNIESFLGFCEYDTHIILVSEFFSSDYLCYYLPNPTFTWKRRLKICIDVARGLNYLHSELEDQKMVIHCDVNSKNIVVDKYNWSAKIVEFGLSVFLPPNQDDNALYLNPIAGTNLYTELYKDPEYVETGKLKRESDVFSFGVVMFEILYGMCVYDMMALEGCEDKDISHLAQRWSDEGTIKEKLTGVVMIENAESGFLLDKGPNEDSLATFINIMCQCVAHKQNQRPTMKVVVKELKKALSFQVSEYLLLFVTVDPE